MQGRFTLFQLSTSKIRDIAQGKEVNGSLITEGKRTKRMWPGRILITEGMRTKRGDDHEEILEGKRTKCVMARRKSYNRR